MNKGRMISISGIDGSGKTTQLNFLAEHLKSQRYKGVFYSELPPTEPISNVRIYYELLKPFDFAVIRSCCRCKETAALTSMIANSNHVMQRDLNRLSKLFIHDTFMWFQEVVYPALEDGKTLLFDRFYWDELPYHYLFHDDLSELISFGETLIQPLRFYLKLPLDKMIDRNLNRPDQSKKIFDSPKKIKRILEGYEQYVETHADFVLDATLSKEEIADYILARVYDSQCQ